MGQRLRDGGEPSRDALLPPRAVGSGHAAAHGRHPDRGRDRGGPLGGGGRPRRLGCHRADPDPGGRRVPRADPGRVPGGSRSSPRPSHGRPTEDPHVHEDALHRMDRRRSIRSLVVSADTAPVLPARRDGDRRGDRRGGARHVPRDRALRTLRVGLEVGSGRVPHPPRPRLRADVLPRARPRQHDHPLRSAGEERRVHDLFRLSVVLRRGVRQPDARATTADRRSRSRGRSPS